MPCWKSTVCLGLIWNPSISVNCVFNTKLKIYCIFKGVGGGVLCERGRANCWNYKHFSPVKNVTAGPHPFCRLNKEEIGLIKIHFSFNIGVFGERESKGGGCNQLPDRMCAGGRLLSPIVTAAKVKMSRCGGKAGDHRVICSETDDNVGSTNGLLTWVSGVCNCFYI